MASSISSATILRCIALSDEVILRSPDPVAEGSRSRGGTISSGGESSDVCSHFSFCLVVHTSRGYTDLRRSQAGAQQRAGKFLRDYGLAFSNVMELNGNIKPNFMIVSLIFKLLVVGIDTEPHEHAHE